MEKLCLDFINSKWYATHQIKKEILEDPDLLVEFFKKRELVVNQPPSHGTVEAMLRLRTFLEVTLEEMVMQKSLSEETLAAANGYLALCPCIRHVDREGDSIGTKLIPLSYDWNWVIAEVVASFMELLLQWDMDRVKICENPDCRWVFYDETKSRTKRWCDDTCASRMKVRRFREKRKIRE